MVSEHDINNLIFNIEMLKKNIGAINLEINDLSSKIVSEDKINKKSYDLVDISLAAKYAALCNPFEYEYILNSFINDIWEYEVHNNFRISTRIEHLQNLLNTYNDKLIRYEFILKNDLILYEKYMNSFKAVNRAINSLFISAVDISP